MSFGSVISQPSIESELPYNLDVKKTRGLQTFTNDLSELGINKNLIRNKKLLIELVARRP